MAGAWTFGYTGSFNGGGGGHHLFPFEHGHHAAVPQQSVVHSATSAAPAATAHCDGESEPAKKKARPKAPKLKDLKVFGSPSWSGAAYTQRKPLPRYDEQPAAVSHIAGQFSAGLCQELPRTYQEAAAMANKPFCNDPRAHQEAAAMVKKLELEQAVKRQVAESRLFHIALQEKLQAMHAPHVAAGPAITGSHSQLVCKHGLARSKCDVLECRSAYCSHAQGCACGVGNLCKDKGCGLASRQRGMCAECGLAKQCEHKRVRRECAECRKAAICKHLKIYPICEICKPASMCASHLKRRWSACQDCCRCLHGIYIQKKIGPGWSTCNDCNALLVDAFRQRRAALGDTGAGEVASAWREEMDNTTGRLGRAAASGLCPSEHADSAGVVGQA